jgi:hypothetical protein
MPPLPPTKDVLDALHLTVLPAAGGAAFAMCLFLVLGRWAAALGSAVAVVVGFACANFTFTALEWEKTGRVFPWKLDEPYPAWHLLPRAALILIVVGLVSRWLGLFARSRLMRPIHDNQSAERTGRYWWVANLVIWLPRVAAVGVTSGRLVSPQAAESGAWVWPALAVAMLLIWVALDGVARTGAGAQVAAYQSAIFLGAGIVLLYAHSARFMDIGVILSFAMFGVAVATGAAKTDASGAIPAGVAFLPALMLNGRILTESNVPLASFWLVALAPLALIPFLIPSLSGRDGWIVRIVRAVLVLTPVVIAVILAAQNEQLVFEEW